MWNSDESFDSDMTKKINDMSESLNLSTKSLQQFMSGNISVGELAATRPTTSKDKSGNFFIFFCCFKSSVLVIFFKGFCLFNLILLFFKC